MATLNVKCVIVYAVTQLLSHKLNSRQHLHSGKLYAVGWAFCNIELAALSLNRAVSVANAQRFVLILHMECLFTSLLFVVFLRHISARFGRTAAVSSCIVTNVFCKLRSALLVSFDTGGMRACCQRRFDLPDIVDKRAAISSLHHIKRNSDEPSELSAAGLSGRMLERNTSLHLTTARYKIAHLGSEIETSMNV